MLIFIKGNFMSFMFISIWTERLEKIIGFTVWHECSEMHIGHAVSEKPEFMNINVVPDKSDCLYPVVQLLSHVWLSVTPRTSARQGLLSFTISRSLFKLRSLDLMVPSNHLILSCPIVLLPSIFSSIRVFSSESALLIWWPKYWSFSFKISPSINIQSWFLLGLTGLISLQSKGLSRDFSNTTAQKRQFFVTQPS